MSDFKRYTSADENIRVSFDPSNVHFEGVVGDLIYVTGEIEDNIDIDEEMDSDTCLLAIPRDELFRVINEWLEGKAFYCKSDFLSAGIDPEGTNAIEFEEIAVPVCRDTTYARAFHVIKMDSPDLENG